MKLSDTTVEVLKNFSTINTGIVVKQGKVLRTINSSKTVLAEANVPEEFPREFAIYDLSKFLGILSLHKNDEGKFDADLDFQEENVVVKGVSGRSKTKVRYTEVKLVQQPPSKAINIPAYEVKFTLTQEDLDWIEKIGAVLKLPHVTVTNQDGNIMLSAIDVKGEIVDDSSLNVGKTEDNTPFQFTIKVENLKILAGTYVVELSARGISKFTHQSKPVLYYISVEQASSSYGEKK